MHLNEYPDLIARSQAKLLNAQKVMRRLQQVIDRMTAKIDTSIAFDADLKNDAQRKARRFELMSEQEYAEAFDALDVAKEKLAELEIDHQLLLNRFSVAKLEERKTIATLELHASHAA